METKMRKMTAKALGIKLPTKAALIKEADANGVFFNKKWTKERIWWETLSRSEYERLRTKFEIMRLPLT